MSLPINPYSIKLVSVTADGIQGDNLSRTLNFAHCLTSADGRYVLFQTLADNFAGPGNDTNGTQDVFLKDMLTGDLTLISGVNGHTGNGTSLTGSLTANAKFAVIYGTASDLLGPGADTNGRADVFLVDLPTGAKTLVSAVTDPAGNVIAEGDFNSLGGMATPDGKLVAFDSFADNLVRGDANSLVDGFRDVFVKNMVTGQITLVSGVTDANGNTIFGDGDSEAGIISDDGRHVNFQSLAGNLVAGDNNGAEDVFIKDLVTGKVELISKSVNGGSANADSFNLQMTGDARFLVYNTNATDIVPVAVNRPNGPGDVIWYDRVTGQSKLVSAAADGTPGDDVSGNAVISADGRYVAFDSFADNLVPGDTNNNVDVFVKDMWTGAIAMVSVNDQGVQGNAFGIHPVISANGQYIAFQSDSTNLVANDLNGTRDVFQAFNPLYNFDPVINSNGGGATADVTVAENTSLVTTVMATDQNINQSLNYAISGGADAQLFKIDANGVLSFVSAPDFEKAVDANHDGLYEVQVSVSDGDFGVDTQLLKVKVTDVNEAPTIVSGGGADHANYIISGDGLDHCSHVVTKIQAVDPDTGDALSYSIVPGTGVDKKGHALFSIDKVTGELSFVGEPNGNKTYTLTVQVADKGGLFDTQVITIQVTPGEALKGTAGTDNFVFRPGFEHEIVKSFSPGPGSNHDILEIDHRLTGGLTEPDFLASAHVLDARNGRDVIISLDGHGHEHDEIVLKDVHKASLTASDFHFV